MDDAGFATAHLVGNSLGGYVALQLAARGRARHAWSRSRRPAAGRRAIEGFRDTLAHFRTMQELLAGAMPHVATIVSTPEGRRRATAHFTERSEHLPPDLIAAPDARARRRARACSR